MRPGPGGADPGAGAQPPYVCARPGCGKPTFDGSPFGYCSRTCRDSSSSEAARQHQQGEIRPSASSAAAGNTAEGSSALRVPCPVLDAVIFADPRSPQQQLGVIGFYFPDKDEPCDELCGAGFLGNFWDVGPGGLQLEAPCQRGNVHSFANAEAAFQALKFWVRAADFAQATGTEAFRLKRQFAGREDFTYGGFGNNWNAMLAVLSAKFVPGTALATALLQTEDTFLLEHNSVAGRDKIWSNNKHGDGTNWLGMQLMLVRDRLAKRQLWTTWLQGMFDFETGKARDWTEAQRWQRAVSGATQALVEALAARDQQQPPQLPGQPTDALAVAKVGRQPHAARPPQGEAHAASAAGASAAAAAAGDLVPAAPAAAGDLVPAPSVRTFPEGGDEARVLELVSAGQVPESMLTTTALRAPHHQSFGFLGSAGQQRPMMARWMAVEEPPAPPSEIPVEEEEAIDEEDLLHAALLEEEPDTRSSAEIYADLVRTERSRFGPLEFAAFGRLKAWDTCADGYSPEEMMAVARWLEAQLRPPPPKEAVWRRLLAEIRSAWKHLTFCKKTAVVLMLTLLAALVFILMAIMTGAAIQTSKVVEAAADGLLTVLPEEGLDDRNRTAAVLGAAVNLHGLLDYASLPMKDLRRVQDVVFTHNGEFHLYQVAGVSRDNTDGGVRMQAQDGTVIRVNGNEVSIAPLWRREETFRASRTGGDPWVASGTFRSMVPVTPTYVVG